MLFEDFKKLPYQMQPGSNVAIGPLTEKQYDACKEFLTGLEVGFSAERHAKNVLIINTTVRQLGRGGLNMPVQETI